MTPGATYRVQLHRGFGFADAADIVQYLAALGVTHLYCSPYLQAVAGSPHGYDVVDPQHLNDELGGASGHARMVGALRDAALGQVLDIVPNHMATDPSNRWWWDVLENGPASPYAAFFDIDWEGPDERSAFTVLVAVLGDHYGRVLEAGDLQVVRRGGQFIVIYFEHELPVSPRTLDDLLAAAARRAGSSELAEVAEAFGNLPPARMADRTAVTERHTRKWALADRLEALCETDERVAEAVDTEVDALNRDPDRLDALLQRQNYRLAYWRTASEELDYRRFFNIETLVGVRVEDPEVFAETHTLVLELVRDGTIDGLRIDHVDGLRDPAAYLSQLADATGGVYTVVEKILEADEALPDSWPVAGTSGYDFLTRVNNLFVDADNEAAMTDSYRSFTAQGADYAEVARVAKHQIMAEELSAEVERLTGLLARATDDHRRHRDHTRRELRETLREFVASFGVYRTYVAPGQPATAEDRRHIAAAVRAAQADRPDLDAELLSFLGELASGDHVAALELEFAQRLQQLTGPVMAKGVEDTAFYRYHRLVSLNEVGGDPGVFGRPVSSFHEDTANLASRWAQSMLALSTHDTKRAADIRARLNVLSELPDAFLDAVERWADRNDGYRQGGWPDRNAEYLLYQTLVGAWPLDTDRAVAYMAKATREAKVHTSWTDPVADYDHALEAFVRGILADTAFTADLERFLDDHRLVERGRRHSLAQTALLLTCPGVPDLYQGTELWDLSLVDPDNRRPVDYELRRSLLDRVRDASAAEVSKWSDRGGPKQWLIHRLLDHRRRRRELYDNAIYDPLPATGRGGDQVVAFSRGGLAVVVACRTVTGGRSTAVDLPSGRWRDVLSGADVEGGRQTIDALLARFPVAVLERV